jgi:nitrate/nitrite transporter NarK
MTAGFTLFSGWLVDRLRPSYLIAIQMLALICATGLALVMSESWLLILYSAAFGVFMGVGSVFDGTVWVNLFGRQHQGAIRGFVAMAGVMGTSIGPFVFGLSYDYLGSYNPSLWLGIGLALIAFVCALLVKKPKYASLT